MKVDSKLFFITVILITIGIVFSLSLSVFEVLKYQYDKLHFFIRQFCVGSFGILLVWILSHFNSQKAISLICFSLLGLTLLVMLAMPFMPLSLVSEVNGARRWIRLPGFSFSPVELFKISFIYFLAWSFSRKINFEKRSMKSELITLLPYTIVFVVVIFIIAVLQNDLGQVFVLGIVLMLMFLLAGTTLKVLGFGSIFIGIFFILFIVTSDHRIQRVQSWWGGHQDLILSMLPKSFAQNLRVEDAMAPYQVGHSLNAIHNGGIFGQGLGEGMFKLGFLSEVHTDFVLSGIMEEVGIVGILAIVFLFYLFLYRIFKICANLQNRVFHLFVAGVGFMFFTSFLINAFGVVSITPVKGLAVPFISYGGSHLLAACFAVGLVLAISKSSNYKG